MLRPSRAHNHNCMTAPPLSFSRWFARWAYRSDILLLLLELIVMNTSHMIQLMARIKCVQDDSGAPAAALRALEPLNPAARRSDWVLIGFPCGASYPQQLLYTLRTGAVLDPWVRFRVYDYCNAGHLVTQLLTLTLALAAPSMYERLRHALFIVVNAAPVLAAHASVAWAPDSLLQLGAAGFMSSPRWRMNATYLSWKAIAVLRLPGTQQLLAGLTVWVFFIIAVAGVDRRIAPLGTATAEWHFLPPTQLVLSVIMIVLIPYAIAMVVECTWTRPLYRAYLRSDKSDKGRQRDNGRGAASSRVLHSTSATAASEHLHQQHQQQQKSCNRQRDHIPVGSTIRNQLPGEQVEAGEPCGPMGHHCSSRGTAAARPHTQQPACNVEISNSGCPSVAVIRPTNTAFTQCGRPSLLYTSPLGGRIAVVSLKVPLASSRAHGHGNGLTYEAAAARVASAAASAVRAHNNAVAAARRDEAAADETQQAHGPRAASRGRARRLRLESVDCVEGCVLLLMPLSGLMADGSQGGNVISMHHGRLELPLVDAAGGGVELDSVVIENSVRWLLQQAVGVSDCGSSGATSSHGLVSPSVALWPPVLSILTASAVRDGRHGHQPPRMDTTEDEGGNISNGDGEVADVAEVLVVVPAGVLCGLSALRCVVTGPMGRQHEVHLDEQMRVPSAEAGSCVAVRLTLPPHALRVAGALSLYLLPPLELQDTPPLASLPLLVLPQDAAREVRQLYASVLKPCTLRTLERMLDRSSWGSTTCDTRTENGYHDDGATWQDQQDGLQHQHQQHQQQHQQSSVVRLVTTVPSPSSEDLVAAADVIQSSGLISLAYDVGYVLQRREPGNNDERAPQGVAAAATVDPMAAADDESCLCERALLGFLSAQDMSACVRLLQSADGWEGDISPPMHADQDWTAAAVADGTSNKGQTPQIAGVGGLPDIESIKKFMDVEEPSGVIGDAGVSAGGASGPVGGAVQQNGSSCEVTHRVKDDETLNSANTAHAAPADAVTVLQQPHGAAASIAWWWLQALLTGFSSPDAEESYQSYKAARCNKLDRMAMVANVFVRSSHMLRTWRMSAAGDGSAQVDVGATGRLLSHLQLEMLVLALWLSPYLLVTALALRRRGMSGRHRNALLMLRGYLDTAVHVLMQMPTPGGGSLLPMPESWVTPCRRYGMHWIYLSCWEPATMQLSAYLQARLALIGALPLLARSRHYTDSWTKAMVFVIADILITTAVAAITDLPLRRRFLRQQQAPANRGEYGMKGMEQGGRTGPPPGEASSRITRGKAT